MNVHIFERLRIERERLGFTQEAFSAIGGVSRRAQANYETSERSPDLNYLCAIAKVGADIQYIVTGVHSEACLSAEDALLLQGFRQLDPESKKRALAMVYGGNPPSSPNIKFNVQGNVGGQVESVSGGTIHVDMRSDKK